MPRPVYCANGKAIIAARIRKGGWTQAKLSEESGVSQMTIIRMEHNDTARYSSFVLVADALGVAIEAIVREHDPEKKYVVEFNLPEQQFTSLKHALRQLKKGLKLAGIEPQNLAVRTGSIIVRYECDFGDIASLANRGGVFQKRENPLLNNKWSLLRKLQILLPQFSVFYHEVNIECPRPILATTPATYTPAEWAAAESLVSAYIDPIYWMFIDLTQERLGTFQWSEQRLLRLARMFFWLWLIKASRSNPVVKYSYQGVLESYEALLAGFLEDHLSQQRRLDTSQ